MNKSEIAERAKFEQFMRDIADKRFMSYQSIDGFVFTSENSGLLWACWERAIAESQAPHPWDIDRYSDNFVELGDGEPSPPPKSVLLCDCNYCPFCGDYVGECLGKCDGAKQYWRFGAAQEVSPVGYVSEIRPRPDDPSCHVCGAQMVVKEWKCLSCGTTTGCSDEEVSPPSPDLNLRIRIEKLADDCGEFGRWVNSEDGDTVTFEADKFQSVIAKAFTAGSGDTRELKAALERQTLAINGVIGWLEKLRGMCFVGVTSPSEVLAVLKRELVG